jgi:hypothetical protein
LPEVSWLDRTKNHYQISRLIHAYQPLP